MNAQQASLFSHAPNMAYNSAMEPGERGGPEQPTLLTQARDRALRLHEVLQLHQADLLRHVESAESSLSPTEPDAAAIREGADRIRRTADAARRLVEGLARALKDDEDR